MKTLAKPPVSSRRSTMAAVLIGTALGTLGAAAPAQAAPDGAVRIVNDMSRYCSACWRNARLHPDYWGDCTQEVFNRLLQRVHPVAWEEALRGDGLERKEFLRAIDAVKKRTQRFLRRLGQLNDVVPDVRDGVERERAEEREIVRQASAELLNPRQQRIMQLSLDGWSVQEIAKTLRLPAERISDEKYKAIRRLRACLAEGPRV